MRNETWITKLDEAREAVEKADAAWYSELADADKRKAYEAAKADYRAIERAAFDDGFYWTCGRCDGTGRWPGNGGVCFNCGGSGFHPNQTPHKFDASPKVRAKREAEHAAKRAAEAARFDSALREIGGEVEARLREVVAKFERLGGYYAEGEEFDKDEMFVHSLAWKLEKYGSLSEKQVAAIQRGLDRAKARQAEAEALKTADPLAEGRYEIEGEVVSIKSGSTDYGSWTKMLVKLADGNKVFGSIPDALWSIPDGPGTRMVGRGDRVTFTARVERSGDDEHFGFFSRPTKAGLSPHEGAA